MAHELEWQQYGSRYAPAGPERHPSLGNALGLWRGGLASLRECALEYGDLVPLRLLWKRFLFVNHPDYAAHGPRHQPSEGLQERRTGSDHILLGDGISLKEGEEWRRERRLMQPSFHRDRMAAYGEDVVALTERAIEGWRGGETRDVFEEMSRLTMAIVGKALLGVDVAGRDSDFTAALSDALSSRDAHARSPSMLLPSQLPTPSNLRMWRARRRLDQILQRVIDRRSAQASRAPGEDRGDLLSALLGGEERGRPGQDGSAGAERDPDGLRRGPRDRRRPPHLDLVPPVPARRGRSQAGGRARRRGRRRAPAATDLPNLRYAGMVVAEVLRLYPPASILIRKATAEIEVGGLPSRPRDGNRDQPVGTAPRPSLLRRTRGVRPGPLGRRPRKPPSPLRLPAFRGRTPDLYWQVVRDRWRRFL